MDLLTYILQAPGLKVLAFIVAFTCGVVTAGVISLVVNK